MKKQLLAVFAGAAMLSPGVAEAYTASQIAATGSCATELLNGSNDWDTMPVSSTGYASFRESSGYLVVDGMYEGIGGGFFNVSGTTISLNFTVEDDVWYIPGLSSNYIYASCVSTDTGIFAIVPLWYNGNGYSYYTQRGYYPSAARKTGTITANPDGTFHLIINGPVQLVDMDSNWNVKSKRIYNFLQYESFIPNLTITEDVQDNVKNESYNRTYDAHIDFLEGNEFALTNFGMRGNAYQVWEVGNTSYHSINPIKGSWDIDNMTVTIPAQLTERYFPNLNVCYDLSICDEFNAATGEGADIVGTLELDNISHVKDNTHNHLWTTNGANARTYADFSMSIPRWQRAVPGVSFLAAQYENCTLTASERVDITHVCSMELMHYGYNLAKEEGESNMIYVKGKVTPVVNNRYVDSYEIYVVPGYLSSAMNANFNHANGHVNGYCIEKEDYTPGFDPDAEAVSLKVASYANDVTVENDGVFARYFPEDDLPVKDPNHKYSFYVKVNYNEPSLEPTFHELTYRDQLTSIESVEELTATAAISTRSGEIVVSGTDNMVEVYALSGVQVFAGRAGTIAVAPGIYMVKVGAQVEKVTVK